MALTWATWVRFRRATRRNDRENELHLPAIGRRWFGSSFGPKNAYFYQLFIFFVFFEVFCAFCFWACVWPMAFL
ncbi:hypothetical protein Hanom_Chr07g00629721 [Helianthus anomalus]